MTVHRELKAKKAKKVTRATKASKVKKATQVSTVKTVSYTHLDVYKRQPLPSARLASRSTMRCKVLSAGVVFAVFSPCDGFLAAVSYTHLG